MKEIVFFFFKLGLVKDHYSLSRESYILFTYFLQLFHNIRCVMERE